MRVNAFLFASALCAFAPAIVAQDSVKLNLGYEYSRGEYGLTQTSRLRYLPFSLAWQSGGVEWKVSSAYLKSQSPESLLIVDDSSPVNVSTLSEEMVSRSGFSDTTLNVRKELEWGADKGIYLDFTGAVRLPTASSGLNVAQRSADYRVQLDAYIDRGRWLPIMGIGYRWMGDGDGITTDNVWQATLGLQYQLSSQYQVGAIYDYRQSSTNGDALKELMSYLTYRPGKDWSLTGYLLTGFTDNSLDFGSGVQLSYRF